MKFLIRPRAPSFLPFRPAVLLLAICLAAPAAVCRADEDGDHDMARRALEQKHARPLADILALVRADLPGKIVGIEFDQEGSRYVYEFKVLGPQGRLLEIYVDALTGHILKTEDD